MTVTTAARRIAAVRARIARVRELLPPTPEAMHADRTVTEALILNLYLALQGVGDLALHAVSHRGLGVPADVRGAYGLLERAGLLDPPLARRLGAAVGLRNRIAHEYGTLDLAMIHAMASGSLGDLEQFADRMARDLLAP